MKTAPRVIALIVFAASLQGCAVALTAAGVAGGAGIQETLRGIKYKTFGSPVDHVRLATLNSLHNLAMKVKTDHKTKTGWQIDAAALDREIDITLEAITPRSTRMRVAVNDGDLFFLKDAATGNEIIDQTKHALAENHPPKDVLSAMNRPVPPAQTVPAAWIAHPPRPPHPPHRPPSADTKESKSSSFFGWLADKIQ